ncbi:MAG TPA: hypothetical protein VMV89_10240 [Candidatus Paceibacterota bacterium]|nr:hypothetical protein [Candidatus Paceibacterota bacterium]
MKKYWLPTDDNGKDALLTNISTKLPKYQATFGLDPADVASTTADSIFFHFCLNAQTQVGAYAQQWTAYKNAARNGSDPALGDLPVAPVLGTIPALVAPDIFGRLMALVAHIKTHKNYTEAIGADLQIIGADHPIDPTTLKPTLYVSLAAGVMNISWYKQGMHSLELWVDRGDARALSFWP